MMNVTRLTDSLKSYNFFITGTAGAGKSNFLRFMMKHLMEKELLVIDLKQTEFDPNSGYKVVTDGEKVISEIEQFCALTTKKKKIVIIDECYDLMKDKEEFLLTAITNGQRHGVDFMVAVQNHTVVPVEIKERLPYKVAFKGAIPMYDSFEVGEAVIITDEGTARVKIPYVPSI